MNMNDIFEVVSISSLNTAELHSLKSRKQFSASSGLQKVYKTNRSWPNV